MPVPVSIKKNIGETGYADVRIAKNLVRIMFSSGTGYEVDPEEWEKGRAAGQYNITMSADGNKIIGVRPVAGTYMLQFLSLGGLVNEVPEPKVQRGGPRQGKDGRHWIQPDSLVWVTILEVMSEGRFKGLKVYNNVPYIFSAIPGSPYTQLSGSKSEIERAETFLRVNGFDVTQNDIPYSSNVLPWMEKKLFEDRRPFLGTITEKGFITTLAELPKELTPKTKKSRKK